MTIVCLFCCAHFMLTRRTNWYLQFLGSNTSSAAGYYSDARAGGLGATTKSKLRVPLASESDSEPSTCCRVCHATAAVRVLRRFPEDAATVSFVLMSLRIQLQDSFKFIQVSP